MLLGILDHFGQPVVDRPGAAADGTGKEGLVETIGVKVDSLVLVMLAYRAFHGESPFFF